MRNNNYSLIFILFFAVFFCLACQNENPLTTTESGLGLKSSIEKDNVAIGELTEEESLGLIHMRLEEKLARDVYIYLGNLYDQKIFFNIQESEERHIDAMKRLLDKYFIEDPIVIDEVGVFPDQYFQDLYDSYILQGETSPQEAIAVGITIEELDISDLEGLITITDNPDIVKVYEKLLAASQIHLSKFSAHVNPEPTIKLVDITEEETLGLIQMRYNEKLAKDVYIYIGNLYDQKIFLNIQESEYNHIDAIKELLVKFIIEDPIIFDEAGSFPDSDFQALYDSYVEQSEISAKEAIAVGIAIEKLLIGDLEGLLANTDNPDIVKVYEKLLASSNNHLLQFLDHVKVDVKKPKLSK